MTNDEEALNALADLDPAQADPPPASGSPRHRQILERAMSDQLSNTNPNPQRSEPTERAGGTDGPGPASPIAATTARGRPHRARWLALAGAAAVVSVIVGVIVLAEPDRPVTPVAALTAAATKTGQVTTLRLSGTDDAGGENPRTTVTGEIDGADYTTRFVDTDPQTGERSTSRTTVIGNRRWDTGTDGQTTVKTEPSAQRNAPYPSSSEVVVKAALKGATVTDLGKEEVRGTETTHYRIALGPSGIRALGELTPSQLARFELEYPQGVADLDVWVADDLIRRIHVRQKDEFNGTETITEFYDFGADITIRPPK